MAIVRHLCRKSGFKISFVQSTTLNSTRRGGGRGRGAAQCFVEQKTNV